MAGFGAQIESPKYRWARRISHNAFRSRLETGGKTVVRAQRGKTVVRAQQLCLAYATIQAEPAKGALSTEF
jgi:hypothetical protein